MTKEPADGHASPAAQDADAVDDVQRNTKSQTEAASYTTTDHDVIRAWCTKRGGVPANVESTEQDSEDVGVLRIEFPDQGSAKDLNEVDWAPFFRKFDDSGLSFVYQEHTSDGQISRFNKFTRAHRDG